MRTSVDEIREIREKIYNETKNMTPEQEEAYLQQAVRTGLERLEKNKQICHQSVVVPKR